MTRDYAAEMRTVIDEMATGTYAAPLVATEIVEKLRANDPELLAGWLDAQAVQIIRHAINLRDCSVRTHNRVAASRSVFRRAAEDFEAGDERELRTRFLAEMYVVEDGTKMPLADMGRPERRFVAEDYEARAAQNKLQSAFIRAIDKKAGNRRTGDVFDEEKLNELWASISGSPA